MNRQNPGERAFKPLNPLDDAGMPTSSRILFDHDTNPGSPTVILQLELLTSHSTIFF
jgi:hypothetical protein